MMMNISSCQHVEIDGTNCTSNSYLCCPHCQLNICLKHVNLHQEILRNEFLHLCEDINRTHSTLNHLTFDSHHQRDYLIKELERWYADEIASMETFYAEKRKQIEILYIKSQMQFDIYKCQKEKQLHENLQKHVQQILQQGEIHRDDFDQIALKLNSIQRGLDELQHLNIQIRYRPSQHHVSVFQWPYTEAAKSLFDDGDSHLWKSLDHRHHHDDVAERRTIICSEPSSHQTPNVAHLSITHLCKSSPKKFKRLQHSTRTTTPLINSSFVK